MHHLNLVFLSLYNSKISPWHTFVVATKSQTKTSRNWLNLVKLWTAYNTNRMVASPNQICTSQRSSKFALVLSLVGPFRAIFFNKVLYFFHHTLGKGQHRYLMGFHIFQNLWPLHFHKFCKLHKFQMPFGAYTRFRIIP